MEMRIDGQNGKRSQTTNLKQHKKTHKKLEVGQTLAQPTGDPKLREKFETPTFSQPTATTPVQTSTSDAIAQLNKEQENKAQQEKLLKQERQLKIDQEKIQKRIVKEEKDLLDKEGQLARLDREKHPKRAKKLEEQINSGKKYLEQHKTKANEIAQKLSDVNTKQASLPLSTRPLSKEAQAALDMAHKAEKASASVKTSPEIIDRNLGIAKEESSVSKYFRELEASSAKAGTNANAIEIPEIAETGKKPYVGPQTVTREATDFERLILEPVSTESATAAQSATSGATPGLKPEAETAAKESKGIWGSIKNAFKGKKGKAAIAVGAAALVGAGLYAVFGGNDDKKAEEVKPEVQQEENPVTPAPTDSTDVEIVEESDVSGNPEENAATTDENKATPVPVGVPEKADTTKVAEKDSAKTGEANNVVAIPEEEKAKEAQEEKEIAEADKADEAQAASKTEKSDKADKTEQVTEQEIKEYVAKNADNYWKYAKRELIAEHQGDANYKPTDKEVYDRMIKIMERNGVAFAKDGIHTNPMLKIGDKVKVAFDDVAA